MALGGGSVGDASISFKIRVDQLQRDLRAARDTTEDAAQKMANSLKRSELQTQRLALQTQRLALQQRQLALATLRANAAAARFAATQAKLAQSFHRSSIGIQALSRQFLVLRAAAGALVGVLGIRQIAEAADAYVNAGTKLKLVSDSAEEATGTLERLFAIAQASRADLTSTVDLFFKLSNAANELGITQEQVISITKTLNQLFKVGGVDAVRAAQATTQFTQTLTKQVVAGDELKSLNENFPPLLRLVAAEMSKTGKVVTATELANKRGGLSVRNFTNALLTGGAEIERQFKQTPTTIADAFTTINNTFTRAIGKASAVNDTYKKLVITLGDLEDIIGSPGFQSGSASLLGLLVEGVRRAADLTAGIGTLTTEIRALAAEFPELNSGLSTFFSILFMTSGNVLRDVAAGIKDVRKAIEAYKAVQIFPPEMLKRLREAGVTFEEIGEIITDDRKKILQFKAAGKDTDTIIPPPDDDVTEIIESITKAIEDLKNEAFIASLSAFQFSGALDTIKVAFGKTNKLFAAESIIEAMKKLAAEGFDVTQAFEAWPPAIQAAFRALVEGEDASRRAIALNEDQAESIQKVIAAQMEYRKSREDTIGPAVEKGEEAFQESEAQQARVESLSKLPDQIDVADVASQELASTLTDLDNLSFDSLLESFASIAQAISEMIVRALLFQAINAGLGGISGAIGGLSAPPAGGGTTAAPPAPARHGMVLKRMRGGGFITDRPTIIPMADGRAALTSEYGQQEAVLPLKRMASGDMGVAFDGPPGGGAGNVINIDARQSTPGTVSAAVQAAVRLAPNAVVNAQSRRQIGRGKAPF